MCGSFVYVFFEGEGKEALALKFKEFIEELLGEPAGVGRVLERPWDDPATARKRRESLDLDSLDSEAPWSFASSVFSLPTYETCLYDLEPEEEAFYPEESDDDSLYLFGTDMPPEWQDAPLILSFPLFALPAATKEERRASRPKARKILRWLRRRQRRWRQGSIRLSDELCTSDYFSLKEVSAARLLAMSAELQASEEAEPFLGSLDAALDLELEIDDPELYFEEPKDQPSWPARLWRGLIP